MFEAKIKNKEVILANKIRYAESFLGRLIGLMFKDKMQGYDGLLIPYCNSIHTFFMRFPIDVLFLDKENKIVKIKRNMGPWRMTPLYFKADKVLELDAGKLPHNINEGEELDIKCIN